MLFPRVAEQLGQTCKAGKHAFGAGLVAEAARGRVARVDSRHTGENCNNDQFQLRAGDGGPMPLGAPGKNCNNGQFQPRAVSRERPTRFRPGSTRIVQVMGNPGCSAVCD